MTAAEHVIEIRLSKHGAKAAGEGKDACIRVVGSEYDFTFKPGETQRVTLAEWSERIENRCDADGNKFFELAKKDETTKIL